MADDVPEKSTGAPPPHLTNGPNHDMTDDSNSIFFAAVKTTRMPMIVTDPNQSDNPIVFANPAFMGMTGYRSDELIGTNCRLLQGPDTDRDTVAEIRKAIEQRREITVEVYNYKKNGAGFWNALFISPVFDADNQLIYFFASQLDVTRRRDAEDGLRQAQKMEAVGQLTGGVAHDFNNLLTVIQGFGDVLKSQIEGDGEFDRKRATRSINAVLQAAERGATLTQQLLAFSRRQKLQGRVVNFIDLIDQLQPLIERTAGGLVKVRIVPQETICNARIDPTQAELAIINILLNARDAMPNGGNIIIEIKNRSIRPVIKAWRAGVRQLRRPVHYRRGHRHVARRAGARHRAVLHDQGSGQGHRSRTVDGLRLHEAVRWLVASLFRGRTRHDGPYAVSMRERQGRSYRRPAVAVACRQAWHGNCAGRRGPGRCR